MYVYEVSDQQVLWRSGIDGEGRRQQPAGSAERSQPAQGRAERGEAGPEGPQGHDAGEPPRFLCGGQGHLGDGVQAPREPRGNRQGPGAHHGLPGSSGSGSGGEGSLHGSC